MAARAILLALFLPFTGVFCFSNTTPFVAWSSRSSDLLRSLSPGTRPHHSALLQSIISSDDICSYDAVVVIDQPGLHSSDLRTLQPSCRLAQLIRDAPASRQLPHVQRSLGSSPDISGHLASRCGSVLIDVRPGSSGWSMEEDKKHILLMSMPPIEGSTKYRKTLMAEHEPLLSSELDKIAARTANYLIIYSGSPIALERRQLSPPSEFDSPEPAGDFANATTVLAAPQGGILQNYQILTPALITSLLVVFFILVPVVMLGVMTLASIQSPLRLGAPNGYNAQEKKVQ